MAGRAGLGSDRTPEKLAAAEDENAHASVSAASEIESLQFPGAVATGGLSMIFRKTASHFSGSCFSAT
jgi:hypothetical protein